MHRLYYSQNLFSSVLQFLITCTYRSLAVDFLNPVTEIRYDLSTYVHTELASGPLKVFHQV